MLDVLESDCLNLLHGSIKYWQDKKWRVRLCQVRRLSPVADTLHLQLFKDGNKGIQTKASLSLDNFRAMESGFTLDRESNTLALLCEGSSIVLAFDAREALIQWQVKISSSVPYVQQFSVQLLCAPARCRLTPGQVRVHVQDLRVSLVTGLPPRLAHCWMIADLRRYGMAEGRFVLEGGARCGRGEGLFVTGVSVGQGQQLQAAMTEAAAARLQARRKLGKKTDDVVTSRSHMSRSCSRDSTLNRSSDGVLLRQASIQWSTWSSEDADFDLDSTCGSRINGDGQSEASASSSDSYPRHAHSSPRPSRRVPCVCSIKTSLCSLRRTGVLDPGAGARSSCGTPSCRSSVQSSACSEPYDRPRPFADHVYEEPRDRPISCRRPGCSPAPSVQTVVAQVHSSGDDSNGYSRPRPNPEGLSKPDRPSVTDPSHVYEDLGPSEGWYQQPRPCGTCQRQQQRCDTDPLYKEPNCPCPTCHRLTAATTVSHPSGSHVAPPSGSHGAPPSGSHVAPPSWSHVASPSGSHGAPPSGSNSTAVCPAIASELILGTPLYARPELPAYAVVNKSNRKGPAVVNDLVLIDPPIPQEPRADVDPEPQYVNTAERSFTEAPSDEITSNGSLIAGTDVSTIGGSLDESPTDVATEPAYMNAPGGHYVCMLSLRRSRSVESRHGLLSGRSLSLGRRKPMPSPKPDRLKQHTNGHHYSAVKSSTLPGCRASIDSTDSGISSLDSAGSPQKTPTRSQHMSAVISLETTVQKQTNNGAGLQPVNKPRFGCEYQRVDRAKLLAQMALEAETASTHNSSHSRSSLSRLNSSCPVDT